MNRLLLLLLGLTLASCTTRPSVTEIRPDGTKVRYSTGVNVMGEVDEVLAEVEAPGIHIRYAAKREDNTRVPVSYISALAAKWLARIQAGVTNLKTKTDGAVALKGTVDPNVIPVNPNVIPVNPNILP